MTLLVETSGGRLELTPPPPATPCAACPHLAALDVNVDLNARTTDLTIALCGNCLAEALALFLGRAHLRAGGRVAELTGEPPAPDDPLGLDALTRLAQRRDRDR